MTIKRIEKLVNQPRFATYDFEWHSSSLLFRMAGFYDGTRYMDFADVESFLDSILCTQYAGWWFFAHAGGIADIVFLLRYFKKATYYTVTARFSGSAAVYVEVKRGKKRWVFVDSFFLLRTSLRSIMKSLGMAKGGKENDISVVDRMSYGELRDYNELDCKGLFIAIKRFADELLELGGELKPTIASCAMTLFRRAYLQSDIRTNPGANKTLRQAYIASRVEVIRKRGTDLYQYDINSSFPYSMTKPAPGEMQGMGKTVPTKGNCFFVDCQLTIPDVNIPPLPYRYADKIFFPVGKMERRWMTGPDFRKAEERGATIGKIHRVLYYDERTDLQEYVMDIYERRRQTDDDFRKLVYKYLLNALYGKFGERTEKTKLVMNGDDRALLLRPGAVQLLPGCIMIPEDREIAHEHVPFAAHITSLSRSLIEEYMVLCGDAYYADTDSVVTGKSDLPTSDALGALKLESRVVAGEYYAPKFYKQLVLGKVNGEGDWKAHPKGDVPKEVVKAKGFSRLGPMGFCHLVGDADSVIMPDLFDPEIPSSQIPRLCSVLGKKGEHKPAVIIERMARSREMFRDAKKDMKYLDPRLLQIPKTLRFDPEREKRKFKADGTSDPYDVREIEEVFGKKEKKGP